MSLATTKPYLSWPAGPKPRRAIGKKSRYRGVIWAAGRWMAEIKHDQETVALGRFTDERQAALQYDRAARLFFGTTAETNASLGLLD